MTEVEMASDHDAVQDREWQVLHDRITQMLDRYGKKDAVRNGDYWLLDENWGWERQQLEFQNLNLLQPNIIKALQALLVDYPTWDLTVRVDVPGTEETWPSMGLVISRDEIIDDLQREYLPKLYRNFVYEGSRPPKR